MAKQTSIIKLQGKVGDLSFYMTKEGPRVRQRGGVDKNRIMTDLKFERTRENMQEFTEASRKGKMVKRALRKAIIRTADSSFHNRLLSTLSKAVKSDPESERGKRILAKGDMGILTGLRLNKAKSLDSTLNCYYEVERVVDGIVFRLEDCCPTDFRAPVNATHFRLFAQGVAFEFEEGLEEKVKMETDYLPMELDSVDLSFDLTFGKATFPQQVYVVGIEFFKLVAGKPYEVAKRKYNAAEVV